MNPKISKPAAPMVKEEDVEHCSHCKQKPCKCIKTEGTLVDKMDGGDMSIGSGV